MSGYAKKLGENLRGETFGGSVWGELYVSPA